MIKHIRVGKKLTSLLLSGCLVVSGVTPVMATGVDKAKSEKASAESQLESANEQIEDIEEQQSSLQAEIDALDADLVTTIASISILEDDIAQSEADLAQANADLEVARQTEAEQYASMKERIRYMYVNGEEVSFFNALMGATSFADALNRVKMFASVYAFDRDLLEEYQETEAQIETLVTEISEEQAAMQNQQADLQVQKESLDSMIASKSAEMDNFDEMLASAEALAAEYKEVVEEKTKALNEQIAAQQQAEAAAKSAASNSSTSTGSGSSASNGSSTNTSSNNSTNTSNSVADASDGSSSGGSSSDSGGGSSDSGGGSSDSSSSSSSSSGSTSSSSVSGSDIANYACQFVGNPYVWGGNSLTNGTDCSGFIHLVYAHFGISVPRQSYSFRSCGREVSPSEMQPGDIICYSGHVALYIGGGRIVHAANESLGIIISSNYAYQTVYAIRRVL